MEREIKKQAIRLVAAWLDKQNKQLLIAIISLRSTLLRQAEEDDPPHGGEYYYSIVTPEAGI